MGSRVDWSKVKVRNLSREDLSGILKGFEQKYGMASADFYTRYNRGELEEKEDFFRWASYYDMAGRSGSIDVRAKV